MAKSSRAKSKPAGQNAPGKLVVILGPTASGKSALGIRLARQFNGEIVSADSRQVYRGMDLGTGKVSRAEQKLVPHHLLDVAAPRRQFSASDFKRLAQAAIADIRSRGRLPFLVGGSAFYLYSVIDDLDFPDARPNLKLRRALQKKSAAELFTILRNLDPRRARTVDKNNPARLIRAIEINVSTGQAVPDSPIPGTGRASKDTLILGIRKGPEELRKLIDARVDERLKLGMVNEVKRLRRSGLSYRKLESFGLEYRFIAHYLQKKISYDDMSVQLKAAIWQFSRRQMTWFRRDRRIRWVKNERAAAVLIRKLAK